MGWKNKFAATSDESKLWALGQKKSLHHYVGWKSEMFRSQERCFFLTSPFIELLGTWPPLFRLSHRETNIFEYQ
jgi:hypothetical protein